jgi:hypothetical protein
VNETSEQMHARAEIESRDFFLWLEGYLEGSQKRGLSEVLIISSRIESMRQGWRT